MISQKEEAYQKQDPWRVTAKLSGTLLTTTNVDKCPSIKSTNQG